MVSFAIAFLLFVIVSHKRDYVIYVSLRVVDERGACTQNNCTSYLGVPNACRARKCVSMWVRVPSAKEETMYDQRDDPLRHLCAEPLARDVTCSKMTSVDNLLEKVRITQGEG